VGNPKPIPARGRARHGAFETTLATLNSIDDETTVRGSICVTNVWDQPGAGKISATADNLTEETVGLTSFGTEANAVVIGATGGIGHALAEALELCPAFSRVFRMSRSQPSNANNWLPVDIADETSIATAAAELGKTVDGIHLVIVATGILHNDDGLRPEKTWRSLDARSFETAFRVNTIGPALVAKHVLPMLAKDRKSVFAALSARVGSIDDNRLGGWHAYRASKAALNMLIKTLSIELAVRNPNALCVGLHPGTVDTDLSKPFQANVPAEKLFTPARSAAAMLNVIDGLDAKDSGGVFAWDGTRIPG
jgi:NAD(P)-dependent dehydrogenase (short-subunit alcohol dehydrogenase family)